MRDLDKALADIFAIRSQIAAGTAFRGYGPAAVAVTGVLALVTAVGQFLWLDDPTGRPLTFFGGWAATALVSAGIVWVEMRARSRRHHSGLADAMIHQAVEQFLPAGAAGALLAISLGKFAPEALWMLPGLWQVLVSLGIFASARSLPRSVALAGAWYFMAGFIGLMLASRGHALSPWMMGLPFVIGQLLMAAILRYASEDLDAEV
jgi:hypothetical protein